MFKSWAVGFGSSLFALFISCIELVVAFIQAVIFTLLSSMYIGSSIEDNHDSDFGH
jgi:F-type H+-transporting ATPase subunit a